VTGTDLMALMPLWIAAGASILIMLSISIRRSYGFVASLSLLASAAAFVSVFWVAHLAPLRITSLLVIDKFALFFMGLFFASCFFVFLLSHSYFGALPENREDFFILVFLASLGAGVLASSHHFVSFFLGLEILSISLYTLISYTRNRRESVESGIKYLVLASVSAAFLLFGIALIYAESGTMDFAAMAAKLAEGGIRTPLLFLGFSLLIVGLGFKLAVVPFHIWTPDVYQGAPAPVTAFVSTVSKGGMFTFLFRFFMIVDMTRYPSLILIFSVISAASMLAGNLLALTQNNVKRILAYSSISHLGYLLVAFLAGGRSGIEAASFYLVAYFITTIAAFGVITVLSTADSDADRIEDYRGMFWRRPWMAAVFTVALLSLAGIPVTAGFIGKFYVAAAGIKSSSWFLVLVLIISSTIGLYYYLRIIVAMYSQPETERKSDLAVSFSSRRSLMAGIALAVLILLLVWFGVHPSGLIRVIKTTVGAPNGLAVISVLRGGGS